MEKNDLANAVKIAKFGVWTNVDGCAVTDPIGSEATLMQLF